MALRPYERQEQVDARVRQVDYSAPDVADVGQVFRQAGRSLLDAAEPILRDKAIRQGESDAGRAPLTRDEDGHLKRADPLPGGGMVYRDSFRKAASTLYKGRLMTDAEIRFEEIRTVNIDNPQQALLEMRAHIEAVSETVPDDIRADIEPDLFREALQRFNGLNTAKVERDRRNTLQGLEEQYRGNEAQYLSDVSRLAEAQDWDAIAAREAQWEKFSTENRAARAGLQGLTPEGAEGEAAGVAGRLGPLNAEIASIRAMGDIVKRAPELLNDPRQLQLLEEWSRGDPTAGKGKVLDVDYATYLKNVPTERGRAQLASWASKQLSDLDRAAAEQAAKDKAEADKKKDEELFNRIDALGADAISGNKDARDAWNAAVDREVVAKAANVTDYMLRPEGQQFMLNQVRNTGVLPVVLQSFIERQASGTNAHVVLGFVEQMTGLRGPMGQYNGIAAWRTLQPMTRAIITKYREMSDAGIPTEVRRQVLDKIVTGQGFKGKLSEAFRDEEGKPQIKLYTAARDKWVKAIFGVEQSQIPVFMRDKVDRDMRDYLAVYGEDAEGAVRAAVEGVATLWTPSPYGLQGFIPSELAGLQLTPSQLDYAFGNYVPGRGHVNGGAGFTTTDNNGRPRARIELSDDSQLPAGLGNYRVVYYNVSGDPIGSKQVNVDKVLSQHFGSMAQLEAKARAGRINAAKAKRQQQIDAARTSEKYPIVAVP